MVDRAPFVVSVHTPKTAGTSLALVYERAFRRRVIFDYSYYDGEVSVSPRFIRHLDFIVEYFAVLHGHFRVTKYQEALPNAKYVTLLRHPVERIISQYLHELNEGSPDAKFHQFIATGQMDVVDFASQEGVGNAMSLHCAGRSLRDYDCLVLSEHFETSCLLFSRKVRDLALEQHFGLPLRLPVENQRSQRPRSMQFDDDVRVAIFNKSREDNELYAEAVEIFNADVRKHLVN